MSKITEREYDYISPLARDGWFLQDGAPKDVEESLGEKGYLSGAVSDGGSMPLSAEGNSAVDEYAAE